jgi:NitT/TauT family transport system ATP-binding protein
VDEAIFLSDRVLVMSAAPGRIIRDLKIELPRPRDAEMATDPVYIEAKKECLKYIRAESLRAFELQNQ